MNNPFEYVPDERCRRAYDELIAGIQKSVESGDEVFSRELENGKMLGVLIASDDCGLQHTLYAFSGQLADGGFYHDGFVEPVFDYLAPDGHFKAVESDIIRQNNEIMRIERDVLPEAMDAFGRMKASLENEVRLFREECRKSKQRRAARREAGIADEAESEAMIRQSQFEKAELHRLKKRAAARLAPYQFRLDEVWEDISRRKELRRKESAALQKWLFDNFKVLNARGEARSLSSIFSDTPMGIPPSGAGECCAPKLLQAAYVRGWHPESIAEFWYGKGKEGEVRIHGEHYPACRGKCGPVLGWMLQGLDIDPPLGHEMDEDAFREPEIIYENEWFCVVDKPEGMLSVPGKGRAVSIQHWLEQRYGTEREVRMAHRLDRDTSGLIIAAFGEQAYRAMQNLFARRMVRKTYIAELEGAASERWLPQSGLITLPLAPDFLDRPRQRVDMESGKEAVTAYEIISISEEGCRVRFHPHTGRTHQLRVHAASEQGLAMPIKGDPLYGRHTLKKGMQRMMLHAHKIEFTFPIDGQAYTFESDVPF